MNLLVSWKDGLLFFLPHNLWAFAKKYVAALNKQKYMFLKIVGPLMLVNLVEPICIAIGCGTRGLFVLLFMIIPPTLGFFVVGLALRFTSMQLLKQDKEKIIIAVFCFIVVIGLCFLVVPKIAEALPFKRGTYLYSARRHLSSIAIYPLWIYYLFFFFDDSFSWRTPLRALVNSCLFYLYHLPVTLVFLFVSYRVVEYYYEGHWYLEKFIHLIVSHVPEMVIGFLYSLILGLTMYPLFWILLNAYSVYFDEQVQK